MGPSLGDAWELYSVRKDERICRFFRVTLDLPAGLIDRIRVPIMD